jgi:hypothetical protein
MTAPRRITLPPLERIDAAVRELVATHDYVNATGQAVYESGDFPDTRDSEDA